MPCPPDDSDKIIPFPGNRLCQQATTIEIPAELDTPEALHQYLLQQNDDHFTRNELNQLINLLYSELKDIDRLVPAQQDLVREEIMASNQGELAYIFNMLFRKYHLMQDVTTHLPCGIECFDTTLAPDGTTQILTANANMALFRTPEQPESARPDMDELQSLGVTVTSLSLEYQPLRHPTQKLRVRAMATPAFQAWFDENLWLTDSLVFLNDEMILSPRTRFFRFQLNLRNGKPWNECYDALTDQLINSSPIGGTPEQLPPTDIYFDDAHSAYLHASDATFPQNVVPFR